jgi:hypothetical protein
LAPTADECLATNALVSASRSRRSPSRESERRDGSRDCCSGRPAAARPTPGGGSTQALPLAESRAPMTGSTSILLLRQGLRLSLAIGEMRVARLPDGETCFAVTAVLRPRRSGRFPDRSDPAMTGERCHLLLCPVKEQRRAETIGPCRGWAGAPRRTSPRITSTTPPATSSRYRSRRPSGRARYDGTLSESWDPAAQERAFSTLNLKGACR